MAQVPSSIKVNTGCQHEVYRTIDKFFVTLRDEISSLVYPEDPARNIEIRIGGIYRPEPNPVPTDNCIHMLLYKQKVIALVTETRTDSNYIQFDFFKNLEGLSSRQ